MIGLAFAGAFGGTFAAYAACTNPSPLPSGYAAPCPVFSVSPTSVSQSGTLSLSASPQPGTDYIYTTAYYAKGSTWLPVTLSGNNAAPSYSSGLATGFLSASILAILPTGTNYVVLWDWLWDATAQCYKGPGLNQCNTGTWRVQMFNLTASGTPPQYTLTVNLQGNGSVVSNSSRLSCPSTCSVIFDSGILITLTANSGTGASFTGWTGCPASTGNTCNLTLSSDLTVAANFSGASYTYSQSAYSTGCTTGCINYYITTTGSDSNLCTQTSPCKTINSVDTKLGSSLPLGSNGTVIHVAPGNYSGPITTKKPGTASARIVWLSDTKWGAKISNVSWTEGGSFVDVGGFDMTNPGSGVCIGLLGLQQVSNPATNVHILGNYCHDVQTDHALTSCTPTGAMSDGTGSHDDWWIGNVIRHTGWPTSDPNSACGDIHGIYTTGIHNILENNIISGTGGWGIQMRNSGELTSGYCCNVVSGNTLFNNNGGIVFDETGNTARTVLDYVTFTNNIIVNNGPGSATGGRTGKDGVVYFHVSGTHWLASNNMVYGNLPYNYVHHNTACTTNGSFSGADGEGNAGGCPNSNSKTDPGTSATFANFQTDTNTSPASNYNPANYQLKSGSSAINQGITSCAASPGLTPCTPTTDFSSTSRPQGSAIDIGAYEQ